MISATVLGNLGRDAELRQTQGGSALSFSVAANRREKQDGEYRDVPTWVTVTLWGQRGEALAPHLKKGSQVVVRGEMYIRAYRDGEGSERHSLEMRADDVRFAGGKREDAGQQRVGGGAGYDRGRMDEARGLAPGRAETGAKSGLGPGSDEDIPF